MPDAGEPTALALDRAGRADALEAGVAGAAAAGAGDAGDEGGQVVEVVVAAGDEVLLLRPGVYA